MPCLTSLASWQHDRCAMLVVQVFKGWLFGFALGYWHSHNAEDICIFGLFRQFCWYCAVFDAFAFEDMIWRDITQAFRSEKLNVLKDGDLLHSVRAITRSNGGFQSMVHWFGGRCRKFSCNLVRFGKICHHDDHLRYWSIRFACQWSLRLSCPSGFGNSYILLHKEWYCAPVNDIRYDCVSISTISIQSPAYPLIILLLSGSLLFVSRSYNCTNGCGPIPGVSVAYKWLHINGSRLCYTNLPLVLSTSSGLMCVASFLK